MVTFARVVAEKKRCDSNKIDYNTIQGFFFDSEDYKQLTKIVTPPVDKDGDYVMESESESDLESDLMQPKAKRKRGQPTSSKPLSELLTEIVSKTVSDDSDTEDDPNPKSNKQTKDTDYVMETDDNSSSKSDPSEPKNKRKRGCLVSESDHVQHTVSFDIFRSFYVTWANRLGKKVIRLQNYIRWTLWFHKKKNPCFCQLYKLFL